jgi:hypothetical protein
MSTHPPDRPINVERFELQFDRYIESLSVSMQFAVLPGANKRILVKSDSPYPNEFTIGQILRDNLIHSKSLFLEFELVIPNDDYDTIDDKREMKLVFEEYFKQKVRHKFYCWKYIRGFINIFCTPIYRFLKPYELFNIELKQLSQPDNRIEMIRNNDELQQKLYNKRLYLEVLLQTLEVKRHDVNTSDVSFKIRLHDKESKDFADVDVVSENKFKDILINGKTSSNPISEIFTMMTMTVDEIKNGPNRHNDTPAL